MGKTFSEKILGRKAGKEVSAGEVVTVSPDYCLSHDNSAAINRRVQEAGCRAGQGARKAGHHSRSYRPGGR